MIKRFGLFFLLGVVILYSPHWSEAVSSGAEATVRAFSQKRISNIEVMGLKRIEKDAVVAKLVSKKGEPLALESVRADIQAIFGMGYFDDIAVMGKPVGAQDVELTYKIKERPVISKLEFEGNEQVDTSDLKGVIKVKEWSILDLNKIREDVKLIQKHYEDKGYYLTKIDFEVKKIKDKDDEVELYYKINDYDKVKIKKITFLNNKVFKDEQLKAIMMETKEGGLFSFMTSSGNFKESGFKTDLQRLTYWYLDHGYVKFRYENPVVTVSDDKKYLYISIYVEEGEQYNMGKIDFSGDLLFPKEELHDDVILTEGKTFKISERNADINKLTEKYQDLGYAFVNVIPKMNIQDDKKIVDIDYSFEKGNLAYFGEITIVGNSKTHDKVVRRELRVHEGELFHGSNLRISKERVERLGYFAPGEVIFNQITRKGTDNIVDLEITVKERSTGVVQLGAGYGSVSKFFFTTQISEINLLGRGQTVSLQAQYAADRVSKSLSLGFTEPYTLDTKWSTGFDFFFVNFPIPNKYLMRKLGFDVRAGYPLTDDLTGYITYKNEGLSITQKEDPSIDSSLDEGVLSSVVWSLVHDKRNNRFEPTGGHYQSASLETAGLGGDKKFLKMNLNNRFYFRLMGDLIFRNSVEYGHITMVGEKPVPPAEKFYLGGPNNMKGYDLFSLGPRRLLPSGVYEPLGGNIQMFSLFELEYPLIREAGLKLVTFYDIGNAFHKFPGADGEPIILRSDVGFGIRWFSPIGPLRFEWGFPLAQRPGEDSPVFQFFVGPPF